MSFESGANSLLEQPIKHFLIKSSSNTYDYIITGMGCAGLSLAVHMIRSGKFSDKKVLLIDKERKDKNDRTWCFWETGKGAFEEVVYRRWNNAWFHADGFSRLLDLSPYQYKMIRGIDYYNFCLGIINTAPGFEIVYAPVEELLQYPETAAVKSGGNLYSANFVFNSIMLDPPKVLHGKYYLLQHFKGWIIETENDFFNPDEATLMDFRPSQEDGTTFVYVMPLTARRALIEYTLFSNSLLSEEKYSDGLSHYISTYLKNCAYKVVEEEFGIIPMTNHRFKATDGRIIHLGTAGGQTKASSGYTFRFIQKNSFNLVESLIKYNDPFHIKISGKKRFAWYDSVLLNILHYKKLDGDFIFRQLFKKNRPEVILRFLDNETSFAEEFRLLNTLPQWPFMKAGIAEFFK
ncbi:MAG: lycopene cyclase family protein [Chitinophagaceae bacterium]